MDKRSFAQKLNERPRLESLLWASPPLVFLLTPLVNSVLYWSRGEHVPWEIPVLAIAMIIVYLSSWLLNDTAPQGQKITAKLVIPVVLFLIIQIWYITADPLGGPYMLAYLTSMLVLQLPRRYVLFGAFGPLLLGTYQSFLNETFFAPFVIISTGGFILFLRFRLDTDREEQLVQVQAKQRADDQRRNQLAADLHDILGQSLTTISVKADLAQRLLEGQDFPRAEQARTQVNDVAALAREALADVRHVVAATKEVSMSSELAAAQELLEAAGMTVRLKVSGTPNAGVLDTNAAYVMRESSANIIHHSATDTVDISLSPTTLRIYDHGPAKARQNGMNRLGTGLQGLKERIGDHGKFKAGPHNKGWLVEYHMEEK